MKTISMDTINLTVFNEQGEFITDITSATGATLEHGSRKGKSYLIINDALLNLKMLEAVSDKEEKEVLNDFDKLAHDVQEETVLKFKHKTHHENDKTFKLIGEGILYSSETASVSHTFKIVAPKAVFIDGVEMDFKCGKSFTPEYAFELLPYNKENDVFDLRLKERKQEIK